MFDFSITKADISAIRFVNIRNYYCYYILTITYYNYSLQVKCFVNGILSIWSFGKAVVFQRHIYKIIRTKDVTKIHIY